MTVLTQTVLSIILAIPLQATPVENDLQYSKIKAASKGIDRCSLKAHLCIAGAKVSSELNMKKKALHLEHKAESHVRSMKTHAEALSKAIGVTRNDETTKTSSRTPRVQSKLPGLKRGIPNKTARLPQ